MISSEDGQSQGLLLAREIRDTEYTVSSLVQNRWYVHKDMTLLELSRILAEKPEIQALGVVDDENKALGVIVGRDLTDLLGRPFGRDVMRKEKVLRAALNPPSFYYDTNILSLSESLEDSDLDQEIKYFPVKTESGEYLGLFSSQDVLSYLSRQAQQYSSFARALQQKIGSRDFGFHRGGFEVAGKSKQVRSLGGDFLFHDITSTGRCSLGILGIGGRGMAPSLIASAVWGALRTYDFGKGIGHLIREINSLIYEGFEFERSVRGFFLEFEPGSNSLLCADLGLRRAYIYRNGLLLQMKTPGLAEGIGKKPELRPALSRFLLEAGDLVLLLSDAVFEQANSLGEVYSLLRVKEILASFQNEETSEILSGLVGDFDSFRQDKALAGDASFVLIRYKGLDPLLNPGEREPSTR